MPGSRREQRRQQLDRLGLLRGGERLEPRRLEHDLVTLGCCAQRHQLAATTGIGFQHSVSEIASHTPMRFFAPVLTSGGKAYETLTADPQRHSESSLPVHATRLADDADSALTVSQ